MDEVNKVLSSPVVKQGLMLVAPEIAFGIQAISLLFGGRHEMSANDVVAIIDKQLAKMIQDITTTKSKLMREELEIRIHTLLEILSKIK